MKDINWNPAAFAELAIPTKKKEVIQALAEAHTSQETDHTFDDFVVGKGLGLIILLQYGLKILSSRTILIPSPVGSQASVRLCQLMEYPKIFKGHCIRYVFQLRDKTFIDTDLADLRRGTMHNGGEARSAVASDLSAHR